MEHTDARQLNGNPDLFVRIAENALTVAEELREDYFKSTLGLARSMREEFRSGDGTYRIVAVPARERRAVRRRVRRRRPLEDRRRARSAAHRSRRHLSREAGRARPREARDVRPLPAHARPAARRPQGKLEVRRRGASAGRAWRAGHGARGRSLLGHPHADAARPTAVRERAVLRALVLPRGLRADARHVEDRPHVRRGARAVRGVVQRVSSARYGPLQSATSAISICPRSA